MRCLRLAVALRFAIVIALAFVWHPGKAAEPANTQKLILLDADWRFTKGDPPHAEQPDFDDARWERLSVPHDWSIDGPFDAHAPTGGAGGFLPAGIGWYRRMLGWPDLQKGQRAFVDFDGVMGITEVWINGKSLGTRPNGYVGFHYDITPFLKKSAGAINVLAVRVDNSRQPASRWYAGAGINRHVWLRIQELIHLESPFITTPAVSADNATVHVQTAVVNQSSDPVTERLDITVVANTAVAHTITPPQTIASGKSVDVAADLTVAKPVRWDFNNPAIYHAVIRVINDTRKQATDSVSVPFGIRDAHFEAATGFWLNGRNIKLKGVCLHGDAGALGVAVPVEVWERRLKALKAIGCNAIRTTHCPPDPKFLDLCDQMGFLVMDEMFDCWTVGKEPYDYHLYFNEWSSRDCADTVRRDRNHPCVILYSVGNEIRDMPNAASAHATLTRLVGVCHENDPTRPVTQALFRPNSSGDYENGLADLLDVVGQNYRENELIAAHEAKPTRKIVGTENGHDRRAWLQVRDTPAFSGEFLWTGFDYLGESKAWPTVGSSSGLFDRTGEPRPIAWERASWWSDTPVVYIVRRITASRATPSDPGFTPLAQRITASADWSPANRAAHSETVEVYSNAASVDLTLNGKSLGAKPLPKDASPRVWIVPFEPGTLRAVATDADGKEVGHDELRTAGAPAAIRLTTDAETLGQDGIAYVRATVVDAMGIPIPDAADSIDFHLTGPGLIVAVDSGDNSSHEPFHATTRKAYRGSCIAIVRMTGIQTPLTITASANGWATGSVTIRNGTVFASPSAKIKP